jgi:hypothetical protein
MRSLKYSPPLRGGTRARPASSSSGRRSPAARTRDTPGRRLNALVRLRPLSRCAQVSSIYITSACTMLRPLNDASRNWLGQMAPEEAEFWGDSLAMEPCYITAIVKAFEDAGGEAIR